MNKKYILKKGDRQNKKKQMTSDERKWKTESARILNVMKENGRQKAREF